MSYTILFTERYEGRERIFLKRHPALRQQYLKTLQLLAMNPFHSSLRLHALTGRMQGMHAVSINLSYRITLEFLIEGRQIIPVQVGDHEAVYRT